MTSVGILVPSGDDQTRTRWLAYQFSRLGEPELRSTLTGSVDAIAAILGAANVLKEVFAGDLVTLDAQAVKLTFRTLGSERTAEVPHLLLYSLTNFSTYMVYWGISANESLRVTLLDQTGRVPVARDAVRGTATPIKDHIWDPDTKLAGFSTPPSSTPLVIDFETSRDHVTSVIANGTPAAIEYVNGHLVLPNTALKVGVGAVVAPLSGAASVIAGGVVSKLAAAL